MSFKPATSTQKKSTFGHRPIKPSKTSSARRNADALKKMSRAERMTGLTVEQLDERQRQLKADFYARQAS